MSKLETLMQQLCPDGVEYKKIGEVAECLAGATPKTSVSAYWENGTIPWMSSGEVNNKVIYETKTKITQKGYESCSTKIVPPNTVVVALAGQGKTRGTVAITRIELCTNQSLCSIITTSNLIPDFLYHYLNGQYNKLRDISSGDGTRGGLNLKMIKNFLVPVPPLEIQREIVRILDNFTELTAELTAELTTELTARKKQLEYYRDTMLSFDEEIPKVKLKDIATNMYRGSGIKRDQITKDGVPCVRYGEIYTTYNTWFDKCVSHTQLEYVPNPKYFEYGDILFAITGESVVDIAKSVAYVGYDKCLAGGDIVVMKHKQNPKYMAYVLSTYEARRQKSQGKIKSKVVHSNIPSIEDIEIPLPPLDVQERLVKVLDSFEAICSDLNIGC